MNTREKGVKGEREVAAVYIGAGLAVRGLEGEGDHLVLGGPRPVHSEAKRQERLQLPIWLRQAAAQAAPGTMPVVAFRQNRATWYVALTLADLAELLAEAQRLRLRLEVLERNGAGGAS